METILRYGTDAQKETVAEASLLAEIRAAIRHDRADVASPQMQPTSGPP